MVKIKIRTINKNDFYTCDYDDSISLVKIDEVTNIIKQAFLTNPLNSKILKEEDDATLNMRVIVSGGFYRDETEFLKIHLDKKNVKNNTIPIDMHLYDYMGVDYGEREKGIKPAEILKKELGPVLLCLTLYHEFTHLIDIKNCEFKYCFKDSVYYNGSDIWRTFEILWNTYINKRLYNELNQNQLYITLTDRNKEGINDNHPPKNKIIKEVDKIWKYAGDLDFNQLLDSAKKLES